MVGAALLALQVEEVTVVSLPSEHLGALVLVGVVHGLVGVLVAHLSNDLLGAEGDADGSAQEANLLPQLVGVWWTNMTVNASPGHN